MTLKLKVGKKGYIIIPKAIRDAVGIEEGDEVEVEVKDYIILKPVRKIDREKLKRELDRHVKRIRLIRERIEAEPGELAESYLEEEFEE